MSVLCLSALESMISDVPSTWRIPSLSILCVIAGQYSLLSFQLKSSQLLASLPFPPPNKTRLQPTSFPVLHSESGGIAYILLVFHSCPIKAHIYTTLGPEPAPFVDQVDLME